jgi:hypothetical protein
LPRRENILVTSTYSGMGQPEPAILENPASIYSALARPVPSVRSLRDRSTWPAQIRASGSDMDQGFTHPPNHRSEHGAAHLSRSSVSDWGLDLTIMS